MNHPYRPPLLDMLPDGRFRTPRRPSLVGPVVAVAALVAVLACVGVVAALALWLAVILVPVALVAGLVAYVGLRLQTWRLRRSARGSVPRD